MSLNLADVASLSQAYYILRQRTSRFTSPPKKGVQRIFIPLKNPTPRLGLNLRPLGPVASTLTTTPPRRLLYVDSSVQL
jgi:hypothetical protein